MGYLILIIAWLFWGFSNAVIWIQQTEQPNYAWILTTVLVQTCNCIVFNLIAIWLMLVVERKIKHIRDRYLFFATIIVVVSMLLVFTNITSFHLVQKIWYDNVALLAKASLYIVNATEKIIYLTGFCTMFFLIRNLKEVQRQKSIAEEANQKARDAQLQLLQQQLSPHFLFNTLNSLRSLIAIDADRARNMVTDLSEFLRVTLSSFKSVQNTIADEIALAEYYLKIQKVRFDSDLNYSITVDKDVSGFIVPKLLLQPLVENAVKFGMQTSTMPLEISVAAHRKENTVLIEVRNSGMLQDETPEPHTHHGMCNTVSRLELMFPGKAHLKLSGENGVVVSRITIDGL